MALRLSKEEREKMRRTPTTRDAPSDEECIGLVEKAFDEFHGDMTILESAVGALFVGRLLGWKALRILHSNATYGKYEKALGVRFKEILPESTPHSRLMMGVRVVESVGNFWQAVVSGRINRSEGKAYEGRKPPMQSK